MKDHDRAAIESVTEACTWKVSADLPEPSAEPWSEVPSYHVCRVSITTPAWLQRVTLEVSGPALDVVVGGVRLRMATDAQWSEVGPTQPWLQVDPHREPLSTADKFAEDAPPDLCFPSILGRRFAPANSVVEILLRARRRSTVHVTLHGRCCPLPVAIALHERMLLDAITRMPGGA